MQKKLLFVVAAAVAIPLLGCGTDSTTYEPFQEPVAEKSHDQTNQDAHDHSAQGPHGGHMIELGNEAYHAEMTHDEQTHTVTVHLFDATATKPAVADQSTLVLQLFQDGKFADYTLKATGEASQFSLVDKQLCDTLLHAKEVRGRLNVTIADTPYTGMIEHHAHDHEAHDDEGHDHEDHEGHDDEGEGEDQQHESHEDKDH